MRNALLRKQPKLSKNFGEFYQEETRDEPSDKTSFYH